MAGANSNIQMTDLDFNNIKTNLRRYLESQDTLKDYNYEGSALSTLLDILAYNTQYNAFYLNMVGNEMFLDSAIQRSSVVSLAKMLNYVPNSALAPTATINLRVNEVGSASLTLPKFTTFISEAIDGVNYNFVTADAQTVNASNNTVNFTNVQLKQGIPATLRYTVDNITNPQQIFIIPEDNVDTTTLSVVVQQSSSNSASDVYTQASSYLSLTGDSKVYFLQESVDGQYEVTFGDDVIGKKLTNGNIVTLSYIVTSGVTAAGANNFVLMDTVGGFANTVVYPLIPATTGSEKESIDSVKFQAPKSYSAQNRAVSKNDYISALQRNTLGIAFDAVNVWGGEENSPPVYGQVFISLKPAGTYNLTDTQKTQIIEQVIKPVSIVTVTPRIVDPDYTYLKFNVNVVYDPKKTTQTAAQIQAGVKAAIENFATTNLNTFNSTFNTYDFLNTVQSYSSSIITSEFDLRMEKKIYPNLVTPTTYKLYYNAPLDKNMFQSGVESYPSMQFKDPTNLSNIISNVYLEEVPQSTNGVETISVLNPGFGYQSTPTITIKGDGQGATAHAIIVNGAIKSVVVDTAGSGYTSAIAVVTPAAGDTTGQLGTLLVNLQGRYGTLRSYYNDSSFVKTILNSNVGTIDYQEGVITLQDFGPTQVDNTIGELSVSIKPTTTIVSSTYNRIITLDPYDSTAIVVNVTAKNT